MRVLLESIRPLLPACASHRIVPVAEPAKYTRHPKNKRGEVNVNEA